MSRLLGTVSVLQSAGEAGRAFFALLRMDASGGIAKRAGWAKGAAVHTQGVGIRPKCADRARAAHVRGLVQKLPRRTPSQASLPALGLNKPGAHCAQVGTGRLGHSLAILCVMELPMRVSGT